jgi:hypothetical protein
MNRPKAWDLLAGYADRWTGRGDEGCAPRQWNGQVRGLLELAEELQGILVPVTASSTFRRRLHGDLVLEAQCQQIRPEPTLFQQHRKLILVGAAAVGSVVSVVGVVLAFVLRHRSGRASNVAAG